MYEEEFQKIDEELQKLFQQASAKVVFLVDKNGQLIASAGDTREIDTTSLASLTGLLTSLASFAALLTAFASLTALLGTLAPLRTRFARRLVAPRLLLALLVARTALVAATFLAALVLTTLATLLK